MPLKVQLPLPSIGLGLYQLGVHIRAKKIPRPNIPRKFYKKIPIDLEIFFG